MLSGQISGPVLRLAQLWQNFQQFRLSIDRLGDIINTPTENTAASAKQNLPPIRGELRFENVTFRYKPGAPEILRELTLDIRAGEVVGLVGRSGSGKSTLTKLLQRLYVPERGRVFVDGVDVGLLDPSWLRRQIGVVLQENVLFNRSVRDNIALADPSMPLEHVMHAAGLAGAHEFILELPHGYDTVLEERGANLSGGQRQRIAIARALLSNPRILIFDEATSALDYAAQRTFDSFLADPTGSLFAGLSSVGKLAGALVGQNPSVSSSEDQDGSSTGAMTKCLTELQDAMTPALPGSASINGTHLVSRQLRSNPSALTRPEGSTACALLESGH